MLSFVSGLVSGSSPVARPMAHPLRGWTVAAEHGPAASIGECSCSELVIAKVDIGGHSLVGRSVGWKCPPESLKDSSNLITGHPRTKKTIDFYLSVLTSQICSSGHETQIVGSKPSPRSVASAARDLLVGELVQPAESEGSRELFPFIHLLQCP